MAFAVASLFFSQRSCEATSSFSDAREAPGFGSVAQIQEAMRAGGALDAPIPAPPAQEAPQPPQQPEGGLSMGGVGMALQ